MPDQFYKENRDKFKDEEHYQRWLKFTGGRGDYVPVPEYNVKLTVYHVEETEITHEREYWILLHDLDKDKTIVFGIYPDENGKYIGFEGDAEDVEEEKEVYGIDLGEVLKKLLNKE